MQSSTAAAQSQKPPVDLRQDASERPGRSRQHTHRAHSLALKFAVNGMPDEPFQGALKHKLRHLSRSLLAAQTNYAGITNKGMGVAATLIELRTKASNESLDLVSFRRVKEELAAVAEAEVKISEDALPIRNPANIRNPTNREIQRAMADGLKALARVFEQVVVDGRISDRVDALAQDALKTLGKALDVRLMKRRGIRE